MYMYDCTLLNIDIRRIEQNNRIIGTRTTLLTDLRTSDTITTEILRAASSEM